MRPIIQIFKTDLKQLYKNPLALLIVIGMIFLAGVYAWLNISSNWDPYNNTDSLPVAVANEDVGAKILDEDINVGTELVKKLEDNNDVNWIFTDKTTAIEGTKSGEYYGAIIIPTDFTDKITSVFNESEIQKPTFNFYVNQKKNPIAPIIVNKIIDTIQNEVNQSFINTIVYNIVERTGILQKEGQATTAKAIDDLHGVQNEIRELQHLLDTASSAANSTNSALRSVQDLSAIVANNTKDLIEITGQHDAVTELKELLTNLQDNIDDYTAKINQITTISTNITDKLDPSSEVYSKLLALSEKLKSDANDLKNTYPSRINTLSDMATKNISRLSSNLNTVASSLEFTITKNTVALNSIIDALDETSNFTKSINTYLDGIIYNTDEIIAKINRIAESELYLGIMNLLQNPPETVADFVSEPVSANEVDIYATGSYGTKMSPFYIILASWVGCTILASVLKTEIEYKNLKKVKPYQAFWGRFIIFAIIAITQGIVISTGALIMNVETQNDFLFVISTALISLIFSIIVYSLVVAFGKIGAGIAVVILVLQVAGSGGTFPIELLPNFFQNLQPFMPFNPALNMLREVIGGFYQDTYLSNLLILLSHTIIPLLLGLVFRKPIISVKEKYSKKLEQSHLIGK